MLFHVDGTTDGEVAEKTVGLSKCVLNTFVSLASHETNDFDLGQKVEILNFFI